jgi:hypothetical protein
MGSEAMGWLILQVKKEKKELNFEMVTPREHIL